jgi:hypothetical protein
MALNRRQFFTALAALVTATRVTAQAGFIATGQLSDAGDDGMYAFGQELALIAKPKSTAKAQLDALVGKDVTISVELA